MKNIELKINVQYLQLDELPKDEQELVAAAIKATDNSNAKYSHFRVGAALLLTDGSVVIGANQEKMSKLAIAARNDAGLVRNPVTPCGSCRQVILEMEERYGQPIRILLYGTDGVYAVDTVRDLLPLCFVDGSMK